MAKKRIKLRKGSPLWYMRRYWIVVVFWVCIFSFVYASISTVVYLFMHAEDSQVSIVTVPNELKPYVPIEVAPVEVIALVNVENKLLGTNHFSRGGYIERQAYTKNHYNDNDVVLLAAILEAECPSESRLPDWDRRLEANVILNRHNHHGGTLQSIIEAGNGTQFNGIRTQAYKDREYSQESYDAAYAVLILGQRVLDDDIRYFSNLSTSTDRKFIDSINWVLKQNSKYGHSFGRAK